MTREKFNSFWNIAFSVSAENIKKKYERLNYKDRKNQIYNEYEKIREKSHQYLKDPDGLLDRHKVAAVLCFAIINNPPFTIPKDQNLSAEGRLSNELFAIKCAFHIVLSFIITKAKEDGDNERLEIFSHGFSYPECKHGKYLDHICKSLRQATHNKAFDIFFFSQILYLIEEYTIMKHKAKYIKDYISPK